MKYITNNNDFISLFTIIIIIVIFILKIENNIETLFSTRDKDLHKHLRRLFSPAFSIKYLNSLEEFMHNTLENLVNKIDDTIKASPNGKEAPFDIWKGLQCYSLDIVGDTMFGQTFDMIKNESHPVPDCIAGEMRFAAKVIIIILIVNVLK